MLAKPAAYQMAKYGNFTLPGSAHPAMAFKPKALMPFGGKMMSINKNHMAA
jgi:hypothetical protein